MANPLLNEIGSRRISKLWNSHPASVSQMISLSKFECLEIYAYHNLDIKYLITTKFCISTNSNAVGAYAKISGDTILEFDLQTK